jgi:hypothetical protein
MAICSNAMTEPLTTCHLAVGSEESFMQHLNMLMWASILTTGAQQQ